MKRVIGKLDQILNGHVRKTYSLHKYDIGSSLGGQYLEKTTDRVYVYNNGTIFAIMMPSFIIKKINSLPGDPIRFVYYGKKRSNKTGNYYHDIWIDYEGTSMLLEDMLPTLEQQENGI